jgi:lysophospholipase L1-like esterase
MNTNPNAIRVLCYGDSNTYGAIPTTHERRPTDKRWTGILQNKLGNNFEIIEEGLSARTIDIDDPKHKGKNGLEYIFPCLASHYPINIIILMLGTNDLKYRFNKTSQDVANGIQKILNEILESAKEEETKLPKIILVCPPVISEAVKENQGKDKFENAEEKSKLLPILYKEIAIKNKIFFVNLQDKIKFSNSDGLHYDLESHEIIANIFEKEILKLCS